MGTTAPLATKLLNPLDAAFLAMESRRTPMHVGGLMVFRMPKSEPQFLQTLFADLRATKHFRDPWRRYIRGTALGLPPHAWVNAAVVDGEHHVRHWALPKPGGERELGQLIAKLHSIPIDLSRPPWEFHLIEGLERDRFAIYVKVHHALADGISGAKLVLRSLSERSDTIQAEPFWGESESGGATARKLRHPKSADRSPLRLVREVQKVGKAILEAGNAVGTSISETLGPLKAPPSTLNVKVGGQRRFATQQIPLNRIKRVAEAAKCSANDVLLAVCSGAIRRFLVERNALPRESLTAGVPVSVRKRGDDALGNAVSMIIVSLATNVIDPVSRLSEIVRSTRAGKARLEALSAEAVAPYTLLMMAPYAAQLITGWGASRRPVFNLVVSNVPGPTNRLYLRGAPLEAFYPVSIVTHGQALNITCLSYDGALNFGLTACRDSLPSMQNIAVYCGDSLRDLEGALGLEGDKR